MTPVGDLWRASRQFVLGWMARLSHFVPSPLSPEYEPELAQVIRRVRPYTMTTRRRIAALCDSVEYVVREGVPGAIVECGVWRGGSMMAAALTLIRLGATDRDLYLFDTFKGMPAPTDADKRSAYDGYSPMRRWRRGQRGEMNRWHYVPAVAVREAMVSTGYPAERIHLVEGRVEDTLPSSAPETVALLRLDTDWYESTRTELEHLYPRLPDGGVLIVDDYGHYEGARRAVDEYFEQLGERPLLTRVDYTARVAVRRTGAGTRAAVPARSLVR
jgi:O-methyltransferase